MSLDLFVPETPPEPLLICKFFVAGRVATKGSHRAVMPPGARFPVVLDDNQNERAFRASVGYQARVAMRGAVPVSGPIAVRYHVLLQRPQNHFGSGRNEGVLLEHAPRFPAVKPDLDKIARSIGDALELIVYTHDAKIVRLYCEKDYAGHDQSPGTAITVWRMPA